MSSRASLSAARTQWGEQYALKPHTPQLSLIGPKTNFRVMLNEYLDNKVSISMSTFDRLEETRLVESEKL
jgi:hypothetical protein